MRERSGVAPPARHAALRVPSPFGTALGLDSVRSLFRAINVGSLFTWPSLLLPLWPRFWRRPGKPLPAAEQRQSTLLDLSRRSATQTATHRPVPPHCWRHRRDMPPPAVGLLLLLSLAHLALSETSCSFPGFQSADFAARLAAVNSTGRPDGAAGRLSLTCGAEQLSTELTLGWAFDSQANVNWLWLGLQAPLQGDGWAARECAWTRSSSRGACTHCRCPLHHYPRRASLIWTALPPQLPAVAFPQQTPQLAGATALVMRLDAAAASTGGEGERLHLLHLDTACRQAVAALQKQGEGGGGDGQINRAPNLRRRGGVYRVASARRLLGRPAGAQRCLQLERGGGRHSSRQRQRRGPTFRRRRGVAAASA